MWVGHEVLAQQGLCAVIQHRPEDLSGHNGFPCGQSQQQREHRQQDHIALDQYGHRAILSVASRSKPLDSPSVITATLLGAKTTSAPDQVGQHQHQTAGGQNGVGRIVHHVAHHGTRHYRYQAKGRPA